MTTATKPESAAPAKPRMFLFECNSKTPDEGAFNGSHLVFWHKDKNRGDRFFLTIGVKQEKQPDGTTRTVQRGMPYWADVVGEYEPNLGPKPIARVAGSAPALPAGATLPSTT